MRRSWAWWFVCKFLSFILSTYTSILTWYKQISHTIPGITIHAHPRPNRSSASLPAPSERTPTNSNPQEQRPSPLPGTQNPVPGNSRTRTRRTLLPTAIPCRSPPPRYRLYNNLLRRTALQMSFGHHIRGKESRRKHRAHRPPHNLPLGQTDCAG